MVVLPAYPFQGMVAWRNSAETQQSGNAPRSGLEIKNGSRAKDGRRKGSDVGQSRRSAPTSRHLIVALYSPPLCRGRLKWREKFSERSDHPIAA